jgi:hypothetical protein
MQADSHELKEAWLDFCERLKGAADIVFDTVAPEDPLSRSEGIRYLSRLIGFGLDLNLEFNDPMFPELMRYFDPTGRKQGGDNPDAVYLGARIAGDHHYRLFGKRGSARYLVFTTLEPTAGVHGGHALYGSPQAQLLGDDLEVDVDGNFELTLGPEAREGNHIQTTAETSWFTIRQFFGDWLGEAPMRAQIERIGATGTPPPLQPERLVQALANAGSFVGGSAKFWRKWLEDYGHEKNVFSPNMPSGLSAAPGGSLNHCVWELEADEVLLIEVDPVACSFWNFELNNYWMNSMDYRYHLSSINGQQAVLEDGGSVRIAVSAEDPGIPNWLDTASVRTGFISNRWMQAATSPVPSTRLLKLSELPNALPANATRISAAERRAQLRMRRLGVEQRFPK